MRLRNAVVSCALAVAIAAISGAGSASAGSRGCEDERVRPASVSKSTVKDSVLCLLNQERTKRGLPRLAAHDDQRQAAARHNRLMIRRKCFSHVCPGEGDLVRRLISAGYLPCSCAWKVAENIAWGTGSLSTPESTVERWMDSPPHRRNILDGDFRHIGIAVHAGTPRRGASGGATYTTVFGMRR